MERPHSIHHLDHVQFWTNDLERAEAFYVMLGARVVRRIQLGGKPGIVRMEVGPQQHIDLRYDPEYKTTDRPNVTHINLTLSGTEPEALGSYLRENNVHLLNDFHTQDGCPTIDTLDPDGNQVELRLLVE